MNYNKKLVYILLLYRSLVINIFTVLLKNTNYELQLHSYFIIKKAIPNLLVITKYNIKEQIN